MKCPACQRELTAIKTKTATVQACQGGCGGLWFPANQLRKVEYAEEAEGAALLDIPRDESVVVDLSKKRTCTNCNVPMMQHFFSPKRSVTIDECPKCAGIWLDAGELSSIRQEFKSEDDRDTAVNGYLTDVFGPELDEEHKEFQNRLDKINNVSHVFRFICPSTYFPPK